LFGIKIDLPDGIDEMLAITGYQAEYLAAKYVNGARIKGTGGFQITDNMGTCMAHLPLGADFEDWRRVLGAVLDHNRAALTTPPG
jgi:hypothetical protein